MSNPENGSRTGWRILLAGAGGQGVITAAKLISNFFTERGRYVVSGQLHGMAQRGGSVQSSVMIDCGMSPVMPLRGADVVIGCEPVETVRVLPFVSDRTIVFMNTAPIIPYVLSQQYVLGKGTSDYPSIGELQSHIGAVTQHLFTLDATAMATAAGSVKVVNVVMLGCLFGSGLLPVTPEDFFESVMANAPKRFIESNRRAFLNGVEVGRNAQLTVEHVWH